MPLEQSPEPALPRARSPRMMHGLPSYAMNKPARGSLLGIEHLEDKEILGLLKLARRMNPLKARPLLRNKRIVLLFYEASTRTRSSFEIAAKSLGAITTLVQSSGSSIEKGESLLDTGYTLRAVGPTPSSSAIPPRARLT
jgi:aspartate carbamoyltransferase catalytic subunit